jgi:hypothetical protein
MEAELIALDTTTTEANWIHELLMDLPIVKKPLLTIVMNYDNQMVIGKVSHPVLKVNRMRTMYVPGSVIHVHSDYINDSS